MGLLDAVRRVMARRGFTGSVKEYLTETGKAAAVAYPGTLCLEPNEVDFYLKGTAVWSELVIWHRLHEHVRECDACRDMVARALL
jgi:hypothetical protein